MLDLFSCAFRFHAPSDCETHLIRDPTWEAAMPAASDFELARIRKDDPRLRLFRCLQVS